MPKLTRKSYTRKLVVVGGLVFASVALISTGLAAFIISNNAKRDVNSNVEIGTISTASLDFEDVAITDNKSFKFDGAEGDNEGRITTSSGESENLKIEITGKIINAQYLKSCTVKLNVPEGLQEAADKKYIVLPDCADTEVEVEKVGAVSSGNVQAFKCVIEFGWGEAFGNTNPSLFFDSETLTDDKGKTGREYTKDEVVAALADFRMTMFALVKAGDELTPEDYNADPIADNNKYVVTLTAYTN